MDYSNHFSTTVFTDTTKRIGIFSALTFTIVILFVISPLRKFGTVSLVMKSMAVILLCYTLYLNIIQTSLLQQAKARQIEDNVVTQINLNIFSGHVLSLFLGLLLIFILRTFLI